MALMAEQRMFPLQRGRVRYGDRAQIAETVYMAAYEVYSHIYGPQKALIDLDGRDCRGGFDTGEMIAFLYARSFPRQEWGARVDEALRGMKV